MKQKFTFIAVLLFLMGTSNVFSQRDGQMHDLRAKFSLSDVKNDLDPETQKLIELRALKDITVSEDAPLPSPAVRGVVWDNGGDDGTGTGLGSQLDSDWPFNAQVADDFMFSSEVEIHAVQWWGQFFNLQAGSPVTTEFNIIFYEDDGSGNMPTGAGPGDPTPTAVAVYNLPEVTGTTVGADRYEYQVNLPDVFVAEADQKYWIAIQWVGFFSTIGQWGWLTNGDNPNQLSESVQGFPFLDMDYWEITGEGDMAFRLYDAPLEPPPPAGEGSDCTDPIVVDAFPFEDLGQTTCGMENTYSNTCLGLYDGGEDIHYQFTLTEEQLVTITMDPKGTSWTGILLTDECPPPGADCIAIVTGSAAAPRVIEEVLQPGTYFIMISTWPAPNCIPDFDLTITATTDLPPPSYCDAGPTSTADSNVENVSIAGENDTEIDHDGCDPAVTGVEDLTGQVVDLYQGGTYTLSVTFGTCGGNFAGAGSVWIDWDQDFEFGTGDLIHESTGTPGTAPWDGPVEITFTVPMDAALGNTVMRVMQWEDSFSFPAELPLDPCASFLWGSVMDFGINILEIDDDPVPIPLSSWALYLSILLFGVFIFVRFRKMM